MQTQELVSKRRLDLTVTSIVSDLVTKAGGYKRYRLIRKWLRYVDDNANKVIQMTKETPVKMKEHSLPQYISCEIRHHLGLQRNLQNVLNE